MTCHDGESQASTEFTTLCAGTDRRRAHCPRGKGGKPHPKYVDRLDKKGKPRKRRNVLLTQSKKQNSKGEDRTNTQGIMMRTSSIKKETQGLFATPFTPHNQAKTRIKTHSAHGFWR